MTDNELIVNNVYKRLEFEVDILTENLQKHATMPVEYLSELNELLKNSRWFYYIISRHLCPVNI